MRKFTLIVTLAMFSLCSCSEKGPQLPMGSDPSWISAEAARNLCEGFLKRQGYTNVQVVGETAMREKCWYTFEANGTKASMKVQVDRKTRAVGYGDWKR